MLDDRTIRLDEAQGHIRSLTAECAKLQAAARAPATPAMVRFQSLEMKISSMDARYRERVIELKRVVESVTARGREELVALQRRHDIAMSAKDAEVASVRKELGALMAEQQQQLAQQREAAMHAARLKRQEQQHQRLLMEQQHEVDQGPQYEYAEGPRGQSP